MRTLGFTYDTASRLTQATDVAATYGFTYDALGRVKKETQSLAGLSPLIEYSRTFNALGSVTTLSAILGGTADFKNIYTYDNLQRLTSVKQQQVTGGNKVAQKRADFTYNAAGQFEKITRFADTAGTKRVANTFYAYDGIGRLSSLIHSTAATAPASGWGTGALAGYQFTYDVGSRITGGLKSEMQLSRGSK